MSLVFILRSLYFKRSHKRSYVQLFTIKSKQNENQLKSSLTTTLRNIFQHLTFKNLKLLDYYNGIQMESLAERDKNSFQNSKKILITKNLIDQFRLKLELSQWLSSMVWSKIKLIFVLLFVRPKEVK